MNNSPALLPLQCLKCQSPLPAGVDEVAWVCPTCGQALILDDGQPSGLSLLTIQYGGGIPSGGRGRPFWVAQGTVVLQRETYSGNQSRQASEFWQSARVFMVPAYACALDDLIGQGMQLINQPPSLGVGQPAPFLPVTLAAEDLRPMAEFIVMGIEAARRDDLKALNVQLSLGPAALWVLP